MQYRMGSNGLRFGSYGQYDSPYAALFSQLPSSERSELAIPNEHGFRMLAANLFKRHPQSFLYKDPLELTCALHGWDRYTGFGVTAGLGGGASSSAAPEGGVESKKAAASATKPLTPEQQLNRNNATYQATATKVEEFGKEAAATKDASTLNKKAEALIKEMEATNKLLLGTEERTVLDWKMQELKQTLEECHAAQQKAHIPHLFFKKIY